MHIAISSLLVIFASTAICSTVNCPFFTPPCPLKCKYTMVNGCRTCTCPPGVNRNGPECNATVPCTDTNSLCANGICNCRGGFDRGDGSKCHKPKELGETCFIEGSYIRCSGANDGVDINCNRKPGPNQNKCVCLPGMQPSTTDNKKCVHKGKKLNEPCAEDSDCSVAYSMCSNGKCKCIDGFPQENNICKTAKRSCPFGPVSSPVKMCERKENPQTFTHSIDTCPTGFACFTAPSVHTKEGSHIGHCCAQRPPNSPKVNITVCPVGDVHPTGKCPDETQPADAELDPKFLPFCPMSTHQCLNRVCCPLPCRRSITGYFSVDNECLQPVVLGNECKVNAQCIRFAECKSSGNQNKKTCQCKPGHPSDGFQCLFGSS